MFGRGNTEDFEHRGLHVAAKAVAQLNEYEPCYILKVVGAPEGEQENWLRGWKALRSLVVIWLWKVLMKKEQNWLSYFQKWILFWCLQVLGHLVSQLWTYCSGLAEALEEVTLGYGCIVDQETDWVLQIKRARKHQKTRLEEDSMLRNVYEKKYCWRDQCAAFVKRLMALHSGWNINFMCI